MENNRKCMRYFEETFRKNELHNQNRVRMNAVKGQISDDEIKNKLFN